jgi:hypothetical protein
MAGELLLWRLQPTRLKEMSKPYLIMRALAFSSLEVVFYIAGMRGRGIFN